MATHDANDLNLNLDPLALKPMFQTKPWLHAAAISFNWIIIILAAVFCIYYSHPITYLLAITIIGARMHALAILMHDATHYRFLKNRKWNDLITNITTMYPLFTSIEQYRENHFRHHAHLNTEDDPDWMAKLGKKEFRFPQTKSDFLWTVFSYFTLYRGIADAIWFLRRFGGTDKKGPAQSKLPKLIFYAILVTFLSVFGLWKYFALFWVVPYLSTFFMFQYIRSVAEHFGDLAYDHLLTSTRSVKPAFWEKLVFAPHHVGYHIEHHLYPAVPFYNLPKLHRLLMTTDEYNTKAHVTQGYLRGLLSELG